MTYEYNDFVGHRGDEGAKVYLVRLPVKKPLNSKAAALKFDLSGIGNTQAQDADGFGNVEFDDVAKGKYLVLIMSEQTNRDTSQALDSTFTQQIRPLFVSDAVWQAAIGPIWIYHQGEKAPPDESLLGLKPAVAIPLTVKGERAHFSHDFGTTYL